MSFRDNLKIDVINCFTNTDEMGEKVIYRPWNSVEKSINASINRHRQSPASEVNSRISVQEIEITISTDPVKGVAAVFRAKDKVTAPFIEGGPSYEFTVVEVLASDAGMWQLLLRR